VSCDSSGGAFVGSRFNVDLTGIDSFKFIEMSATLETLVVVLVCFDEDDLAWPFLGMAIGIPAEDSVLRAFSEAVLSDLIVNFSKPSAIFWFSFNCLFAHSLELVCVIA
jgi:hypothetical protein